MTESGEGILDFFRKIVSFRQACVTEARPV
jgi:hypothetical protein